MTTYPKAVWQPVANHSGVMSAHYGLCVHVQVGSGSCYGEFNNPASQASSTWQAMKDGTVLQFVDADYVAWTEMAGNPYYDSVETEGTPDEPLTAEQCQSLAELMAWGHGRYGWPLVLVDHGGRGITTHAHYPSGQPDPAWGNHPCPGPIRSAQLPGIVAAAARLVNPPTPQPPPPHRVGDKMLRTINVGPCDSNGNGWHLTTIPWSTFQAATLQGPYPPTDGYWPGTVKVQDRNNLVLVTVEGATPGSTATVFILASS